MDDTIEQARSRLAVGSEAASLSLLGLTDAMCAPVASLLALPEAAPLAKLDLSCNSIGPAGAEVLLAAVDVHPSVCVCVGGLCHRQGFVVVPM
jgi:hypothetical protein